MPADTGRLGKVHDTLADPIGPLGKIELRGVHHSQRLQNEIDRFRHEAARRSNWMSGRRSSSGSVLIGRARQFGLRRRLAQEVFVTQRRLVAVSDVGHRPQD